MLACISEICISALQADNQLHDDRLSWTLQNVSWCKETLFWSVPLGVETNTADWVFELTAQCQLWSYDVDIKDMITFSEFLKIQTSEHFCFVSFSRRDRGRRKRKREAVHVMASGLWSSSRASFPETHWSDQDEERVCVVSSVRRHAAHAGSVAALRRHPMAVSVSDFLSNHTILSGSNQEQGAYVGSIFWAVSVMLTWSSFLILDVLHIP